jgi:hypothetical protein
LAAIPSLDFLNRVRDVRFVLRLGLGLAQPILIQISFEPFTVLLVLRCLLRRHLRKEAP